MCFLLAVYAFAVFGYVTATIATFFIDRDAERPDAALAGERSIATLEARLDKLEQMLDSRLPKNR